VFTYNYDFHGVDTWIGDRLVSFQSHGADGGKKFAVDGAVGPSGSQMTVNQKKSQGPAFLFTCNYWRLPPGLPKNQPLPTVDASTGATQNVRVADAAPADVTVGDTVVRAAGFRLTGDVDATLWVDAQGRIVRQQSVEQGYATELRLIKITREAGGSVNQAGFNAVQWPTAGPAGAPGR
jgi:Family of unknown function (DUF6134)